MDSLFAPWRMDWVQRESSTGDDECTFCELPARDDDRKSYIVCRTDHVYVLLNNRPYNPGHAMIIPFEHTRAFHRLDDEVLFDAMQTAQHVIEALNESLAPSGYNIGFNLGSAGGASIIDHLHMHVIPRWESDTSFMPLTANTAVVEEAIDETYDRLRDTLLENETVSSEGEGDAVSIG